MTITRAGLYLEISGYDCEIAAIQDEKGDCFEAYRNQLKDQKLTGTAIKDEIAACKKAFNRMRALEKNPAAVSAQDDLVDEIVSEIQKPVTAGTEYATRARHAQDTTINKNSNVVSIASTNSPVSTPTPSPIPEQTEPVADGSPSDDGEDAESVAKLPVDASSPIPDDELNRIPNFLNRAPVDLVSV